MKYGSRVQVMGTHRMIAMSSMVQHGPHMHGGKVVRMRGRRVLHQVDTFEEFIEAAKDDCNVLFVWLDHKDHLPMYTEMCEVGDFELSAADEDHVYVMARDATKGKACEILAGLYGIRPTRSWLLEMERTISPCCAGRESAWPWKTPWSKPRTPPTTSPVPTMRAAWARPSSG